MTDLSLFSSLSMSPFNIDYPNFLKNLQNFLFFSFTFLSFYLLLPSLFSYSPPFLMLFPSLSVLTLKNHEKIMTYQQSLSLHFLLHPFSWFFQLSIQNFVNIYPHYSPLIFFKTYFSFHYFLFLFFSYFFSLNPLFYFYDHSLYRPPFFISSLPLVLSIHTLFVIFPLSFPIYPSEFMSRLISSHPILSATLRNLCLYFPYPQHSKNLS